MSEKRFYLVSALKTDSSQLGHLKRWDTEKEAVAHAKNVIEKRESSGDYPIEFYIIEVKAKVGREHRPMKVTKLKEKRS